MAQRTPHPAHPSRPARYAGLGNLVFVHSALQADASTSRIRAMYDRTQAKSGHNHPNTTAAWDAFWALKTKTEAAVESARQRGALLMCWHGTAALNDGAA